MKKGCLIIFVIMALITGILYLKKVSKDTQNEAEYQEMLKDYVKYESSNMSSDTIKYINVNNNALSEIKEEEKVKEVLITESNILYVSVYDDGTRRDGYASYLCQILKEHKSLVRKVKVVKFGSHNDSKRDNAYGVLLGESDCNF